MKKLLWTIAIVFVLGTGFLYRETLAAQAYNIVYLSPCDAPTKYKIGTIDKRFGVSEQQFLRYIDEAGTIWNTASGKTLFAYDPNGPLTINLEYDERQSLNSQINELDTKLDEQNKQLEPKIQAYEQRVASFKAKASALNQEIDSWNAKGGAPADIYADLITRQRQLQQESRELQQQAADLGQSTQSYNNEVQELSQTVDTYNQALKFKPEEGIYIQDENGRRIIIYFYNTETEVVHTLAHELGHALGLDHINNTQAVMFSRTNNAVTLTTDDLSALTEVCRKRSVLEIAQKRLQGIIAAYQDNGKE